MTSKITVLIPTFNRSRFILECLDSILKQTYKNLEVHIYDDGSTDDTIKKIESLNDDRIKIVGKSKRNNGVGYARNKLLESVKTKVFCWQDSDDLSNIHRIKLQSDYLKKTPEGIVFSRYCNYKPPLKPDIFKENYPEKYLQHLALPLSMCYLEDTIPFETELKSCCEDVVWLRQVFLKKPIIVINKTLYYRRIHENHTCDIGRAYTPDNVKSARIAYERLLAIKKTFPRQITRVLPEVDIDKDLLYLKARYRI